jgi:protein-S-isoprenylcysteine O-methyltransferase Ste14
MQSGGRFFRLRATLVGYDPVSASGIGPRPEMKRRVLIVILLPLLGTVSLLRVFHPDGWSAARIAGLLLLIVGMALVTVARVQLGNSFSISPQATHLVTRGIYSRIRNPVYVFSAVYLVGLGLYVGWPFLFLFLLVLIPVQVLRARAEARILEEHFGEQYREYKASTWF